MKDWIRESIVLNSINLNHTTLLYMTSSFVVKQPKKLSLIDTITINEIPWFSMVLYLSVNSSLW